MLVQPSLQLSRLEATLLYSETVLFRLLSFLSLQDIVVCSSLSSIILNVIRYYKSVVWNPDVFFRPWFNVEPEIFRSTLNICGAVVAGSQINQFLDRTRYENSDMDIFLRIGGLQRMGEWLAAQGYRFVSSSTSYGAFRRTVARLSTRLVIASASNDTVKGVFNYERYVASTEVVYHQRIQLAVVNMNPIHHVLFDFHSTAVMNHMVSDAVVSVFPRSTFLLCKSYVSKSTPETAERSEQWRAKYRERGWVDGLLATVERG
ncbi:hypothetical protein C8F04DRAFT_1253937 [Mycena alexandri]|uniref:Uncharacterized protein n=1 Tax=Mycena alexandri TaxID=1745969 RepID=A0AAD6TB26_9AGAR|nr:hypothetical protein C8F04DRAFT_1253937 [Mycena alexandri]